MKPRAPAASEQSSPHSCRRIASFISKRRSNVWQGGTRPIPMRSSGNTFRDPRASPKRCAAPWERKMGRYVFKLPDVGEGTAEAEIVAWHVAVGDRIEEDQHLVDVMTDKATVEMTSPVTGVIVSLHGEPGGMAAVGAPLVELEIEGAGNANARDTAAPTSEAKPQQPPSKQTPQPATPKAAAAPAPAETEAKDKPRSVQVQAFTTRAPGDKPLASPAVRRRAEELGIQLQFVP